ncbi:ras GEF [Neolentinus lepideus HHB14362 ss-1]|uniref:Ras GEF n=1 Tax=Neolentinus lepideus HHB14362 ss-1 TaxID=1314782 RepID=A0A165U2U3_9AGAM|nr:ras GEF [Neolentinus lepideus HHB14362 ss-1]
MSGHRAQTLRRTLHLSIDPSPYGSFDNASLSSSGSISPSSSARASIGTSLATNETSITSSDWKIFSVLCLYDFHSDDPDHLAFRKSEILDVVKQEESGWWAAMRPTETQVGWIPSAFVRPLSEETAERLRGLREEVRIYDYKAERLYNAAPTHLYAADDDSHREEWGSLAENSKEPAMEILSPTELIGGRNLGFDNRTSLLSFRPQSPLRQFKGNQYFTNADTVPSPTETPAFRLRPPPSPVTPMPQPPPPTLPPKMVPVTRRSPKRYNSTPLPEPPDWSRRGSDSINRSVSATARYDSKRQPVRVDEQSCQTKLYVLTERNNIVDPDDLSAGEMDDLILTPARRRSDKVKQLTGDEDAQRYHNMKIAALHMPWYMKPNHKDEEVKLLDGIVIAGTLEALVERLTIEPLSESVPISLSQEAAFQNAFLMTFKTFATADEVFDLLVDRYQMDCSVGLTDEEFEEWKERKLRPTQSRVLTVLTRWIEDYRMTQEDPHIVPKLQEFLSYIVAPHALALTAKLMMQSLDRLSSPIVSTPSSSTSNPTLPKYKKKPRSIRYSELTKMDPTEVAQQLCVMEFNLYSKIRPQECLDWTRTQTGKTVENLHAFCATHDKLAAWVKTSILETDVLGKRADTVEFWIRVAEKSRALNNLSSLSALVAALSSSDIVRLHLTWAHVSRGSHLEPLIKLIEPTGNFSGYRVVISSVDGPCVPWVGMYLSDLVHIGDQHADTIDVPTSDTCPGYTLINFLKRQKWCDTINVMLKFQGKCYPFAPDPGTLSFIETNLQKAAGKDHSTFYFKSQEVQRSELAHADIRKGLEAAGF